MSDVLLAPKRKDDSPPFFYTPIFALHMVRGIAYVCQRIFVECHAILSIFTFTLTAMIVLVDVDVRIYLFALAMKTNMLGRQN